jgi:hypothetical protein
MESSRFFIPRLALCLAAGVAVLASSACGDTKRALGFSKRTPDEFRVLSHPPLSMPPDYSLRPPSPGATGAASVDKSELVRETLIQNQTNADRADLSEGEKALLSKAGASGAQSDIRQTIYQEQGTYSEEDEGFWNKFKEGTLIVDKKEDDQKTGNVIDAKEEAKKLPKTSPDIERRPEGFVEEPAQDKAGE